MDVWFVLIDCPNYVASVLTLTLSFEDKVGKTLLNTLGDRGLNFPILYPLTLVPAPFV